MLLLAAALPRVMPEDARDQLDGWTWARSTMARHGKFILAVRSQTEGIAFSLRTELGARFDAVVSPS